MMNFVYGIILKVLSIGTVLAQNTGTGGNTGVGYNTGTGDSTTLLNPLAATSFPALVQAILGALFTLSIPICSIMIMIGGYYIMSAAGNEERLKTGRNTIAYAAIGFLVILLANGVVSLIRSLTGV